MPLPPHDVSPVVAAPLPSLGPMVTLSGHVEFVEGYAFSQFVGCHAGFVLDDTGKTVALLTTDQGMQGLLETALATGYAVQVKAQKYTNPPNPYAEFESSPGTWGTTEVYSPGSLILWNLKSFITNP
jgi:hypothetical protein